MAVLCGGIDLGTSNSVIATYSKRNECVPSSMGYYVYPSIMLYNNRGELKVSESAQAHLLTPNVMAIQYAKRVIGYRYDSMRVTANPNMCISSMREGVDGKVEFYLEGWKQTETPISVYVKLLKHMLHRAEEYNGSPVTKLVLTIPADFKQEQILDTEAAIQQVGFSRKDYTLLKEPIAAAIGYNELCNNAKYTLVYDLGGGTFDVTLMQLDDSNLKILSYGGDETIGGLYFDHLLKDYVIDAVKERTGLDLLPSPRNRQYNRKLQKLLMMCREVKQTLVAQLTNDLDLNDIANDDVLEKMEFITITQPTLKNVLKEPINRTIEVVDETIRKAGLTKDQIDRILMVGGSSRLLAVSEALTEYLGDETRIKKDVNPDEIVALGASFYCKSWANHPKEPYIEMNGRRISFVEPITITLGYKGRNGDMVPLVKNGDPIPSGPVRKLLTTDADDVQYMRLEMYQGEKTRAEENMRMKPIEWYGFPALPKGEVKFVLSLFYSNSLWECEVRDFYTKKIYVKRQLI